MPSKRKSNKRAKMEKRRARHNQNKKEGVNMTENITGTTEMASEEMAEAAVVAESKTEDGSASGAAELNTEADGSTIVAAAEAVEEPAAIVEEEIMENKKTENTTNATNATDLKETVHKLYIQYNDLEFSDELLFEAAVNAYCSEKGLDKSSVEAVNLYVKPQEGRAYYVINNDAEKSGSIEL